MSRDLVNDISVPTDTQTFPVDEPDRPVPEPGLSSRIGLSSREPLSSPIGRNMYTESQELGQVYSQVPGPRA